MKMDKGMAKHKRTMTGDCGEFYVASLLAGMYSDVKVERVNEKAKDLNVTIGRRSFTVQVKAGREHTNEDRKRFPEESRWVWRAGEKCVNVTDKRHWYAFVYLGEWPKRGDHPKVFFLSAKIVSQTLRENPRGQRDWFWIFKNEAEQYCGVKGFMKMMKVIKEN
jgi:hypothetical protein